MQKQYTYKYNDIRKEQLDNSSSGFACEIKEIEE